MLMKNYFDLKVFVTVVIALILFKIIDNLFLDATVKKMFKKNESFEDYEVENYTDDVDDDLV